jgi:FRG domain
MALPDDYWRTYETTAPTLEAYLATASALADTWPDRTFVWRGVVDARWALHSSLYRRACAKEGRHLLEGPSPTTTPTMAMYESQIVEEARRWGLQRTATDRLSALELLAALQHQGVPTRFIDFTHNAVVALWFAVEERYEPDGSSMPDLDGRVFVAQVRPIAEGWARDLDVPWNPNVPDDWLRDLNVWTPPPIDPRMTRQQGCFVFGGVPTTVGGWNIRDGGRSRPMLVAEIRSCVSVPIRLNNPVYINQQTARGNQPAYPLAFTVRIPAGAKPALRRALERGFGYTHSMMYPDYPGFAQFGRSIPRV